jgi:regulator of sigma E protease
MMTNSIFAFIVVLGVLIFVHELGHFLVARLCGVGVEKFSLGFGPRLIGKKIGITDYRVSAIPLGGFVKMVGDEPGADIDPENIPISFENKSVFKRMSIVAAGPLSNFGLAVFIFYVIFQTFGMELIQPVVGSVVEEAPVPTQGFALEDRILAIDGVPVKSWRDITEATSASDGRPLSFTVRRQDADLTIKVVPTLKAGSNLFGEEITQYSVNISPFPVLKPIIGDVHEDTPAQRAGLQKNDLIIAVNGKKVASWKEMAGIISESKGKEMVLAVLRENTELVIKVVPELVSEKNVAGQNSQRYMIGIAATAVSPLVFTQKLNPLQALGESVYRTYDITRLTIVSVVKLIQGRISAKTLGGPIMIAEMAGQQAKEGMLNLLFFIAVLSINLGVLNFLPIPVLDGGHLLFFLVEAIKGSPVKTRVREVSQQVGVLILVMLMIFVFYNDIMRVFFS